MDMALGWHTRAQKRAVVEFWMREQNGICCLCSDIDLPMDPYYRQHDKNPFAATLEHLTPKRDGGPDIVGNVRLAHKFCNNALGSTWSDNLYRVAKGLKPISIEQALNHARSLLAREIALRNVMARHPVEPSPIALALVSRPAPPGWIKEAKPRNVKNSLASAIDAGRPLGLPRGATLPGYVEPEDAPIPRLAPRPRDLLDRKSGEKVRRPICVACGSTNVRRDASLRWDLNAGWIIAEHRDGFECLACDADAAVCWEFVNHGAP